MNNQRQVEWKKWVDKRYPLPNAKLLERRVCAICCLIGCAFMLWFYLQGWQILLGMAIMWTALAFGKLVWT